MANKGYIKINRSITEWEWYKHFPTYKLFTHFLYVASWKKEKYRGKVIERGELYGNYEQWANETGLTKRQVQTAIRNLISTGEISKESNKKQGTKIIILKYDFYQKKNNKKK